MLEKNDCTVRSLAQVSAWGYVPMRNVLRSVLKRKTDSPVNLLKHLSQFNSLKKTQLCNAIGIEIKRMSVAENAQISKFIEQHPVGRYLIFQKGHVLALVNSKVEDDFCSKALIRAAFEVYLT